METHMYVPKGYEAYKRIRRAIAKRRADFEKETESKTKAYIA